MEVNSSTTIKNTIEENTKKIKSKTKKVKKSNAQKPQTLKELLKTEPETSQKNSKDITKKKNSIESEDSYQISRDSKVTNVSESRDSVSKISIEQLGNKNQEKEILEPVKENFSFYLKDYFNEIIEYFKKTEKSEIDFSNSKNFMTKEDFLKKISLNKEDEKNNEIIPEKDEKEIFENYDYPYDYNNGFSDFKNFEQKFKLQPFFTFPEIMIVDSKYSKFDNCNDSNMFYDKMNNCNPKNKYKNFRKKKCNFFIRRRGDWLCEVCGNLNFGYRENCNRCNAAK